jgi:mono/diheme cytochrome c family protein
VEIFDRDELLARTDVVEITTSRDVAYRTPRTYRAVALAKLFEGAAIPPDAVVEAAAQDGFVTQLARDLIYANDGIVGYMAIEAVAVDPTLPALHPARDGQIAFVNKCFTCHTMNGAGPASVGPDLNLPMNPTEYFTDRGLRALIRDPRSVRVWPEQRMPNFAEVDLSDEELGLILAYLRHMVDRKRQAERGSSKR